MNLKESPPPLEPKPAEEPTQPNKQTGDEEAEITASQPVVQEADSGAQHSHSTESEKETDRKQDEARASLADQTHTIKKQTDWVRIRAIASTFLGAVTLVVLVYHGWIMRQQSKAMINQTTIMEGQLKSMNAGSEDTQKMVAAMQEEAKAATSQAVTSQVFAEQNKDLVQASLAQAQAAKQSVGASQASARAAEKGAQIAQESFYIGDRPYVFSGYFAIKELAAGVKPEILFVFHNTGKTPALNFKFGAIATIANAPSPSKDAPHGLEFLPRFPGISRQ